jgi:cell division protease FtsH
MALVGLVWMAFGAMQQVSQTSPTWSEAKRKISEGAVEQVTFEHNRVRLQLREKAKGQPVVESVERVTADDAGMVKLLEEKGVPYRSAPPSACEGPGMSWFLILAMSFAMMTMMARRDGGAPPGVAAFGKSQARLAPEEGTGITFADVAGIDEAIEELEEIVHFLKTPEKFTALGGKIPKGVLLVGPPGTGKTLLARAVAGEAGVPFFSISGSDFVEMFVGVGAARVRDLFQKAGEHAPCIIFIDELDAVGKARGAGAPMGGHDEREQTLNQILVEMDGFDGRKGIIIVAATNRPETLDPALLRAGRFDRQVLVDRPDVKGREAILKVHARTLRLAPEVDLSVVARMTPGFAGADLANTLNEAALLAARRDRTQIELEHIEAAVERIVAGLEKKSRRLGEKERSVVAYHEAGHAICAAACPGADPVQKISIIPRGIGALGYTLQTPMEDRYLMAKREMQARLVVLYGGRIAEQVVFGEITTGASDDIRKASDLARRMIQEFGMSDRLGPIDYGGSRPGPMGMGAAVRDIALSEKTAESVDEEVRRELEDAWRRAHQILIGRRDLLDRMARHLLDKEVLERDDLATFLAEVPAIDLTEEVPRPAPAV